MSDKEEDSSVIQSVVHTSHCENLTNNIGETLPQLGAAKRPNLETVADLCKSSENKPLSYHSKRQRTKSGPEQMEPSINNTVCHDKEDFITNKNGSISTSLSQQITTQNPLCERNIRVDNDNNALNKNQNYDKNTKLPSTDLSITSYITNTTCISSNLSTKANLNPTNIIDSINNNNTTPDTNNTANNNNNNATLSNKSESNSLTSAISSLETSHPQRSPSTSTLDYVACLPDGYTRQSMEGIDDVSATPPYVPQLHTPVHQFSGDEDDDNYLDSSDDEDCTDTGTYNEEDESCGEDDGSVVSTVGSTCSLRSVASEALATIYRNEQGQTINQDGSLLYSLTPSTQPLPPFSPSLFSHVPPVVRFCQHNETCQPLPECVAKLLKWRYTPITPLIIRKTVTNSGFKMTKRTILWSGTWGKHMKSTCFKSVRSFQKVNHFPGTFQIGRKDKLWKNFLRLQVKFGKEEFGFMPKTFVLPAEINALKTAFDKEGVKKKWIVKPPASARGTGIQVVDKWSQLDTSTPLVVQRYISRPYLINNTKFDLRIYVLVISFHPLRIYLYQDGLVRFASVEYRNESTSLSDRFMHLTNYSVNKTNSSYTHNTEAGQCTGHRWTLCTLWGYLKAQNVDTGALWSRIADMVIKTILSGEHDIIIRAKKNLRSKYSCFELFGFDVLLDERLRPWLLEVNISPSLHSACSLDYVVKGPMMAHLLTMAGLHVPDHRSLTSQMQTDVLSDMGLSQRVSRLTLDHRLYTRLLTDADNSKQAYINSLPRQQYLTVVLATLSPDDVRHLVLGEDEIQRAGKFTCIFPTAETHQYFGFFDKPRYYNRLWDAWETAYGTCRQEGIKRLDTLCAEKYHLIVPPKFKMPRVVGAPPPRPPLNEASTSQTASCSASSTVTAPQSSGPTSGGATPAEGDAGSTTRGDSELCTIQCEVSADGASEASGDACGDRAAVGVAIGANSVENVSGVSVGADNKSGAESRSESDSCSVTISSSNNINKKPILGLRCGYKKSRLTKRRPYFKVNQTKAADGCSTFLDAGLVIGGRGEVVIVEEEEEEDCDEVCDVDGELTSDLKNAAVNTEECPTSVTDVLCTKNLELNDDCGDCVKIECRPDNSDKVDCRPANSDEVDCRPANSDEVDCRHNSEVECRPENSNELNYISDNSPVDTIRGVNIESVNNVDNRSDTIDCVYVPRTSSVVINSSNNSVSKDDIKGKILDDARENHAIIKTSSSEVCNKVLLANCALNNNSNPCGDDGSNNNLTSR